MCMKWIPTKNITNPTDKKKCRPTMALVPGTRQNLVLEAPIPANETTADKDSFISGNEQSRADLVPQFDEFHASPFNLDGLAQECKKLINNEVECAQSEHSLPGNRSKGNSLQQLDTCTKLNAMEQSGSDVALETTVQLQSSHSEDTDIFEGDRQEECTSCLAGTVGEANKDVRDRFRDILHSNMSTSRSEIECKWRISIGDNEDDHNPHDVDQIVAKQASNVDHEKADKTASKVTGRARRMCELCVKNKRGPAFCMLRGHLARLTGSDDEAKTVDADLAPLEDALSASTRSGAGPPPDRKSVV